MDVKEMEVAIFDTYLNLQKRLSEHETICVSVSGGSDSDDIVHFIATQFRDQLPKIHFVFSNTGLEYKATLDHLDYLEGRYGITIDRIRGMPIPVAVKKYGIPFISKQVSEYAGRLQHHDFDFRDGEFGELTQQFPRCESALRWWCNAWGEKGYGEKSRFNINWNPHLKEFLLNNPPDFPVSNMCCTKSKKEPLMKYQQELKCDLVITGERKAEKGQRARKSSCFERSHGYDHHMPLFWWSDEVKAYYEQREGIVHSKCYTEYGLKRTGCVGCPFALKRQEELDAMKKHEPKLYKACIHVFGKSYELTDRLIEFKKKAKEESTYKVGREESDGN